MQALVQTFFIFLFLVLALANRKTLATTPVTLHRLSVLALVTELAVGITALFALAHVLVVFLLVSKKK